MSLVLAAVFAGSVAAQEGQQGARASDARSGPSAHQRIEALASRIEETVGLLEEGGTGGGALPEGSAPRWSQFVSELEREVFDEGGAHVEALARKLRRLRRQLEQLERLPGWPEGPGPAGEGAARRGAVVSKAPPSNDLCTGAFSIAFGGSATGDTSGATASGTAGCASSVFSPDVWFRYNALEASTVNVDTRGSGFDTVLSVYRDCPASQPIACNDDAFSLQSAVSFEASAGSSYWIRVSGFDGASGPFELSVGSGGEISGTVRSEATGEPIAGGDVRAIPIGSSGGGPVASTGPDGSYNMVAVRAGGYRVRTFFPSHVDELYDDIPCPRDGGCELEMGDAIEVGVGSSVTGVDFSLRDGGVISGTVTDFAGAPLEGVFVSVYELSENDRVEEVLTDAAGRYRVGGLAAGSYSVSATKREYRGEEYDDMPCSGSTCRPPGGTPVELETDEHVAGIDFALDRLGVISGTVTRGLTGEPVGGASVIVLDVGGSFVGRAVVNSEGRYVITDLEVGSYLLIADNFGYLPELYADVPCQDEFLLSSCEGSGVPVAATLNVEVTDIDFTLGLFGRIAGVVTRAGTGEPLDGVVLSVLTQGGSSATSMRTNTEGRFLSRGLPPGSYFVRTINGQGLVDEAYDDVPCIAGRCAEATGSSVPVTVESLTEGVDFQLVAGGSVTGTVTDAETGGEVHRAEVHFWDASGTHVVEVSPSFDPRYAVAGLPPGTYFLTAEGLNHAPQLFSGLPCWPTCDVTAGTAVTVAAGAVVEDVDLSLSRWGTIGGELVLEQTGELVQGTTTLWTAGGEPIDTDFGDRFSFDSVAPATYFLSVEGLDIVDELFADIPCEEGCDVTGGTPVVVAPGGGTVLELQLTDIGTVVVEVVDLSSGLPLSNVQLFFRSEELSRLERTDISGVARFHGVQPDTYSLIAKAFGYVGEVYDDIPCELSCESSKGRPIVLGQPGAFVEVGVALLPEGARGIAGKVRGSGGQPLEGVVIQVSTEDGIPAGTVTTGRTGEYYAPLVEGTFFASTANAGELGYADQIYPGIPCGGSCDPQRGEPIVVHGVSTAGNVDFDLSLVDGAVFSDGFESGDLSAWAVQVP